MDFTYQPETTPANHTFVFLAGMHRSGTSILFKCLKEHPDTSGFETTGASEDEGQLLQTVYPPAHRFGGPGIFGFHQEMHMDETHPLCTPKNRDRLFSEWAPYWDLSKPVLLEKSPPNLTKTRFLQGLFPTSVFVIIMRHPIAVALATRKLSRSHSLSDLVEHWLVCHEAYRQAEPHLRQQTSLRYEDFIVDPNSRLAEIYQRMGVTPVETHLIVKGSINQRYFEEWQKLRAGLFTARQIRRIEERFEDRVARLGYSLYL